MMGRALYRPTRIFLGHAADVHNYCASALTSASIFLISSSLELSFSIVSPCWTWSTEGGHCQMHPTEGALWWVTRLKTLLFTALIYLRGILSDVQHSPFYRILCWLLFHILMISYFVIRHSLGTVSFTLAILTQKTILHGTYLSYPLLPILKLFGYSATVTGAVLG